jgi:hypothetical protein
MDPSIHHARYNIAADMKGSFLSTTDSAATYLQLCGV